jgi:hypothetical protein
LPRTRSPHHRSRSTACFRPFAVLATFCPSLIIYLSFLSQAYCPRVSGQSIPRPLARGELRVKYPLAILKDEYCNMNMHISPKPNPCRCEFRHYHLAIYHEGTLLAAHRSNHLVLVRDTSIFQLGDVPTVRNHRKGDRSGFTNCPSLPSTITPHGLQYTVRST